MWEYNYSSTTKTVWKYKILFWKVLGWLRNLVHIILKSNIYTLSIFQSTIITYTKISTPRSNTNSSQSQRHLQVKPLHARTRSKFCANFVPLAYKNRPYLGICGNSEDQLSNWYYYPCLLQSIPIYPLPLTSNQ